MNPGAGHQKARTFLTLSELRIRGLHSSMEEFRITHSELFGHYPGRNHHSHPMLKAIRTGKATRLTRRLMIATLVGGCLLLWKAEVRGPGIFKLIGIQPVAAQFLIPQDAWRQVYERLPDLPRENQYVSKETGKVDPDDTLVSRLIRYHVKVKLRPPNYRFDWKLTLADYLGVNEYLVESGYPSNNTLRENPMEGDRAAIQKLTRAQREALVDVLVSVLNPTRTNTKTPTPSTSPSPQTTPTPRNTPTPRDTPVLPKPGDSQLLLPQ